MSLGSLNTRPTGQAKAMQLRRDFHRSQVRADTDNRCIVPEQHHQQDMSVPPARPGVTQKHGGMEQNTHGPQPCLYRGGFCWAMQLTQQCTSHNLPLTKLYRVPRVMQSSTATQSQPDTTVSANTTSGPSAHQYTSPGTSGSPATPGHHGTAVAVILTICSAHPEPSEVPSNTSWAHLWAPSIRGTEHSGPETREKKERANALSKGAEERLVPQGLLKR